MVEGDGMLGWRRVLDALRDTLERDEGETRDSVLENLVDTQEICERLKLSSRSTILNWRTRNLGFPEPVRRYGRTDVYWWPSVEAWWKWHAGPQSAEEHDAG